MADQHITQYRQVPYDNPYISHMRVPPMVNSEVPTLEEQWEGSSRVSEWKDLRLAALQRDHYRCTNPNCGSTQNLDVHHIIPRTQRPDLILTLDNLTTLCEKCHIAAHQTRVLDSRTISFQSRHDGDAA